MYTNALECTLAAECVTKISLVRKEKQLGNLWTKVFLSLSWCIGEVGYHNALSQHSSRVRVPYTPQYLTLNRLEQ